MLPIVDLDAADAADQLAAGLEELGFVQLVGHGASAAAAADLRTGCDELFALDEATKRRFVHPSPLANRGFRARGSEALSYSLGDESPPDLFESFNCGSDARVTGHELLQPTPWPDDAVPEFRAAAHGWLAEMDTLARRLDELIDGVLGTSLAERSSAGPDTMACIDYRPDPGGSEQLVEGQLRMGAHSDYTTFTLLHADPVPGLQIVDRNSEWMGVEPEPGALLVNVGDLLAMLTNDTWPSTLHRVVPMAAGAAPTRRSVAVFHYPDLDVEIAPLPAFGPPRYEPVRVEDHLVGKLAAPKTLSAPTSASTTAGRLDA
ncbi:MAG: 2OG-Fe(II) oxygenase family protein [Actinomycetota bacterium]